MSKRTLAEEIILWVEGLDYWEQYLASKLLNKKPISDREIANAYIYFLEDNGLAKKDPSNQRNLIKNRISEDIIDQNFYLKEIKNVKGVNALKEDQIVPISKSLSVIYGDNGVGKSGYIRIMNNAFMSRGDMAIEANIYSTIKPKEKSCVYKFINQDSEYELKYPDDSNKYEFACYAVFDTKSVAAHLSDEDEVHFLPKGLEFFDSFARAVEKVKNLLELDIAKKTPENPFLVYFENETSVKELVEALTADSDIRLITKMSKISEEEANKHSKIERELLDLRKTDVTKKVKKLKSIKSHLTQLKGDFENVNRFFSKSAINSYKDLIQTYFLNKELSEKEGIAQFKTELLVKTGSKEWKNFIIAAQEFAEVQTEEDSLYPAKDDVCLLCQQPLSTKGRNLLNAYWKYLSSNAENALKKCVRKIEEVHSTVKELDVKVLDEDSVLHEWLLENAESSLKVWKGQLRKIEGLKRKILQGLSLKQWDDSSSEIVLSVKLFSEIENLINSKILKLNEAEISKKIKQLEREVREFNDRKKLEPLIKKITNYISDQKWARKADECKFSTRKITGKQKELFSRFVTEEYVNIFNSECDKLDANFGIEIYQRAQKGNTLKHLNLKGKKPMSVLSEGEQRAVSIADFLAEIQIGDKNKGIIFDDPVNSLDHYRRQIIAERLVYESKRRQVIIFTHDITFLLSLIDLAVELEAECITTTIRKIGNTPGIVSGEIPWVAANVKDRIKRLNEMIQDVRRTEKEGNPDKYCFEAKKWSGLLRETWERAIEELLFNDAIQRFSPAIQTKRIEKIKFTPELYKEIETGMTKCSNWVHDQARAINTPPPTCDKLELLLKEFTEFVKKFR